MCLELDSYAPISLSRHVAEATKTPLLSTLAMLQQICSAGNLHRRNGSWTLNRWWRPCTRPTGVGMSVGSSVTGTKLDPFEPIEDLHTMIELW
jgi:hypothetical protein